MNPWFRDPRAKKGEAKTIEAESVERRGDAEAARALYREAAEAFAGVAISVPADHPNTRSDLAIAAVVCFARAGDARGAVELAHQVLAKPDALSMHGKAELTRLASTYAEQIT